MPGWPYPIGMPSRPADGLRDWTGLSLAMDADVVTLRNTAAVITARIPADLLGLRA
jgi:hypothetical protein